MGQTWKYAAVLVPAGMLALLALPALQPKACSVPLTYRIGTIDPRFALDRATAIDALGRAAAIWDKAGGKTLFRYDEGSDLPVNFVYGDVQQERNAKQSLVEVVENNRAAEQSLKQQVSRLKNAYKSEAGDIRSESASLHIAFKEHNERVEYWGSIGALAPEDRSRLDEEAARLSGAQADLNARVRQINDLAQQINFDIARYNALVAADKNNVATVNRDATVVRLVGDYVTGGQGKAINIFEVVDTSSLVNVLAHELGHALGMPHNDNHRSIMVATGDGPPLDRHAKVNPKSPSPEDLAALHAVCDLTPSP